MWRNKTSHYGLVSILLHWLMALLVCGLFGLGLYMVDLSYYDAWYKGAFDLHKSLGVCVFLLLLVRFVWRLYNPKVQDLASLSGKSPSLLTRLAPFAHGVIYILIACVCVAGYLISTADGRAIDVFALFSVPALGLDVDGLEDTAGEIHEILAWFLIGLAILHALAALKHHFINKDNTLRRMLGLKGSSQ